VIWRAGCHSSDPSIELWPAISHAFGHERRSVRNRRSTHCSNVRQAALGRTLRSKISMGQKRVKPLCTRFAPTKAVNHNQYGLTNSGLPATPNASEIKMKEPAMMRIMRSMLMFRFLAK